MAGAGLAGLTAAVTAAEKGRSVVVAEAGDGLGGTAMFSGGGLHVWGATSWDEYRQRCPLAHPVLGKELIDRYAGYIQWLQAIKAPGRYGERTVRGLKLIGYQIGGSMMPRAKMRFFKFMKRRLERQGGRVLFNSRARELVVRDGNVVGLVADGPVGALTVRSKGVVLAMGGFQSSTELLAEHIGPTAGEFVNRAVAHDVGDGLRMALAAGAAQSASMGTLYGHLMPAPPCRVDWSNYLDPILLSAYYAEHGIVVNIHGERFVDEGEGELSGLTNNAACQQPPGGLWIILDHQIRRRYVRYELPRGSLRPSSLRYLGLLKYMGLRREPGRIGTVLDSLRLARDKGAVVLEAGTVAELAQGLERHGVNGGTVLKTVSDFNASVRGDAAEGLAVPKTISAHKIETPPFYAIKVAPGVSMTYGGVAINERAEVLDKDGATIEGLYAAPGTAGGIQELHYGGALAACGVYGMIAGESAASATGKR